MKLKIKKTKAQIEIELTTDIAEKPLTMNRQERGQAESGAGAVTGSGGDIACRS